MHQKRLAAGLRPDPLGELTALPLAGFKSVKSEGRDKGRRKGEKTGADRQLREGTEEGGKGREGKVEEAEKWEKNGSRNLTGVDLGVTRPLQSDPTSTWNLAKST